MIPTLAVAALWVVIGFAVLAAPVLDLILFAATLPHRFAHFRAERASLRARQAAAEREREPMTGAHDRDWHA